MKDFKIVIGTTNPGKIREIANILSPLGYEFDPQALDIDEIGETIEENAIIKAKGYSKENPGKYVIAEDSGLVVPYLNGLPGAYSSRFHSIKFDETYKPIVIPREEFTTNKTEIDKLNNEKLRKMISDVPENSRAAYFEVCFVVMKDGEVLFKISKESHGYIITEERGTNGFGYDPIFVGNDTYGKTYAELDAARKNMRSHRKKALKELGFWIANNVA